MGARKRLPNGLRDAGQGVHRARHIGWENNAALNLTFPGDHQHGRLGTADIHTHQRARIGNAAHHVIPTQLGRFDPA
jgi:hypothetical protein